MSELVDSSLDSALPYGQPVLADLSLKGMGKYPSLSTKYRYLVQGRRYRHISPPHKPNCEKSILTVTSCKVSHLVVSFEAGSYVDIVSQHPIYAHTHTYTQITQHMHAQFTFGIHEALGVQDNLGGQATKSERDRGFPCTKI